MSNIKLIIEERANNWQLYGRTFTAFSREENGGAIVSCTRIVWEMN